MKLFKVIFILLLLLPSYTFAQSKSKGASKPKTETTSNQYPLFNTKEAAHLWQMWIRNATFTQEDYGRVLDLCIIAYDYLNADMQELINKYPAASTRRNQALKLDTGVASEMTNFVRSFSTRMHVLAWDEKFSDENVYKTAEMLQKKEEFNRLSNLVYH